MAIRSGLARIRSVIDIRELRAPARDISSERTFVIPDCAISLYTTLFFTWSVDYSPFCLVANVQYENRISQEGVTGLLWSRLSGLFYMAEMTGLMAAQFV